MEQNAGAAAQMVVEEGILEAVVCGPAADKHLHGIDRFPPSSRGKPVAA
jgi:hypothetical protein